MTAGPKDSESRRAALTDLEGTLLVEAGAGSGKTALLAGRVVAMLASGVPAESIAAVTFTEMAAAELRERIERYVKLLRAGTVPKGLETAFGAAPTDAQRDCLDAQEHDLDRIVCTTIHGFCQRMLRPFPAEAGIDPGARVLDNDAAALLFDETFADWMSEALSGHDPEKDIVTCLAVGRPDQAFSLFRELADRMKASSRVMPADVSFDPSLVDAFTAAAEAFSAFAGTLGYEADGHADFADAFSKVAERCRAALSSGKPHVAVTELASMPLPSAIVTSTGGTRQYRLKGKWQAAAPDRKTGEAACVEATALHGACCEALAAMRGNAADAGLRMLAECLRPLLDAYADRKAEGAWLDFDDLLWKTLDMLRREPEVARRLGERHSRILVDEFQDTDPVQIEIFRRLAFDGPGPESRPRPGAVFLVGDPKQAIYRFRGADVGTYVEVRDGFEADEGARVLSVAVNFRSRGGILDYVNDVFRQPLSRENGQPGFTDLEAFRGAQGEDPAVMCFPVPECPTSWQARDEEARIVADMCLSLVGTMQVADEVTGETRFLRASDVALLAPAGTDLWRYESALEKAGLAVSTQAGKGMYQRQEIHDLIALVRAVADPRDTVALGALLRGPLVGLTEEELLDASAAIPDGEDGQPRYLHVGMDLGTVENPVLRGALSSLAALAGMSVSAPPHAVVAEAMEMFRVRPLLKLRYAGSPERALANVERFLESSIAYSARGLRRFSDDMRRNWEERARQVEGRPDSEGDAVSLITMHSSKGLEWPVVIPVNGMTSARGSDRMTVDMKTGVLSAPFLEVRSPACIEAMTAAAAEVENERRRLWYVALTRARDLLLLPRHAKLSDSSWAAVVDMKLDQVPEADFSAWPKAATGGRSRTANAQDSATFEAESSVIAAATKRVSWVRPSRSEHSHATSERLTADEILISEPETDPLSMLRGGRERGDVLHKIMEEVLTGETDASPAGLEERAAVLVAQYEAWHGKSFEDLRPVEIARTARRALDVPEVAELLPRLRPEMAVYSLSEEAGVLRPMAGVIDALERLDDGTAGTVVDWKSDMRPDAAAVEGYVRQVRDYMQATGSKRGLVVLMTPGRAVEVTA